eukprot:NODE_845_length_2043_cov_24.463021_g799_i0.p1 GENE.NODE_845_length_2043_cov_24.463021_g799_i0~~NODE_845_length_2043_cov_24.463021_g799_i0.p1  ORF type:complete len:147 (+),score=6.79 NODE_845_length_2043_cov_24.463021_g799_i0:675-1115(+)
MTPSFSLTQSPSYTPSFTPSGSPTATPTTSPTPSGTTVLDPPASGLWVDVLKKNMNGVITTFYDDGWVHSPGVGYPKQGGVLGVRDRQRSNKDFNGPLSNSFEKPQMCTFSPAIGRVRPPATKYTLRTLPKKKQTRNGNKSFHMIV